MDLRINFLKLGIKKGDVSLNVIKMQGCDYMVPYKYAVYSSKRAMDMYIDFMNIPDNPLDFDVPSGFMITEDMMKTFISAAYLAMEEKQYIS